MIRIGEVKVSVITKQGLGKCSGREASSPPLSLSSQCTAVLISGKHRHEPFRRPLSTRQQCIDPPYERDYYLAFSRCNFSAAADSSDRSAAQN
jgi:hypothetical protein